ncbi:MAG: hypothetical protein MJE66_12680 [Proteobacteria bacterium]|nr:hypothetical protein [Pseudomonadota bacterium]
MSSLAERTRRLGFRTLRAKNPLEAIELCEQSGSQVGAAVVSPDLPVLDLALALENIRGRVGDGPFSFLASGTLPDASTREQLRNAGVELALWDPVGDHALRFQLNRALCDHEGPVRGNERIPTEWGAIVFQGGRQKPASVYSASREGLFLETPRPSTSGSEIALELLLPSGAVTMVGRVIYTNVPGNLRNERLPNGMAMRFTEINDDARYAMESAIAAAADELRV